MRISWNLGRIAGIDLYLHPSAFLLFLFAPAVMPEGLDGFAYVITLVGSVVALLGSVVLHELGHALMARRYGIGTADITLYLFGGVARLERLPRAAGPELLIALAGPAVNFAILLGLAPFLGLANWLGSGTPWLFDRVLELNLVLGLFNLLPIFPMDGGRVLRAVLSGPLGRLRATEVAAFLGRTIALVAAVAFLANGMFQPLVLAVFIYFAGSMELRQVRGEYRPTHGLPPGLIDVPPPPAGFRWADRGDGVWRLVPVMAHFGGRDRPWA